jgi:ribokinase
MHMIKGVDENMAKISVVGSINMDIVTTTKRFPNPGETLTALSTSFIPGGKGANQAVAAARTGASVAMVGAVGADIFGDTLRAALLKDEIDVTGIVTIQDVTTGTAVITVDSQGQNTILISKGANEYLKWADVQRSNSLCDSRAILLQNEISMDTIAKVVTHYSKSEVKIFYNPSPIVPISYDLISLVDYLILNQHEASQVTGQSIVSISSAKRASRELAKYGAKTVILTLGSDGLVYQSGMDDTYYLSAFPVKAVDSTAAGDTFAGAFVTGIVRGDSEETALQFSAAAAALSVTKPGAQSSIPWRHEVESFLNQYTTLPTLRVI